MPLFKKGVGFPRSKRHVAIAQKQGIAFEYEQDIAVIRTRDAVRGRKQHIVLVQKQAIAVAWKQAIVPAQKQDIAPVLKQGIGPNLSKWVVMWTPLCGEVGLEVGQDHERPQNGVVGAQILLVELNSLARNFWIQLHVS